ncbi:PAS domain S-box protein [Gemmobacter denitrificans]|uniref:histidine kinase n=1 Tax=Gemmobacter denitrificans TaxID=3123040 RepID=A0ABU8BXG3_9RHOB
MGVVQPSPLEPAWPGDPSGLYALVIELLGQILQAPLAETDATINAALERMGSAAAVDRAYVFQLRDGLWLDNTHEWCAPGIEAMISRLQNVPRDEVGPLMDQLATGQAVHVADVAALPDGPQKAHLQAQDIRTVLLVPLVAEGRMTGLVGYDVTCESRQFQQHEVTLLRAVAGAIGSLLQRSAAHEAEERAHRELQATLHALPDLILQIDDEGRYVDYHSARADLLARPHAEMIGHLLEEVVPPTVATVARQAMAEADRAGRSAQRRYSLPASGGERWFDFSCARRPCAFEGDRSGYVFVIREVTADQQRQNQLLVLEEVVRLMTNLVVVLDCNRRILWANPAFETRSGYRLTEALGRDLSGFARSPDTPAETIALIDRAFASVSPCRTEIENIDRRGNRYWTDMTLHPLRNAQGTHIGFVSVETDITEGRNHAARLAELARQSETARRQLQTAIEALPDAFVYFDPEDRLTLFNHRYSEFFPELEGVMKLGTPFKDILRCGLERGVYRDAIGREEAWLAEKMRLHLQDLSLHEIELSDGRWLRVLERATPEGGRVGMRIDITALKRAERRLEDIIDAADAGTWEWDITTGTNRINARWASILGYRLEEIEPLTIRFWEDQLHPDDRPSIHAELERVFSGEEEHLTYAFRMRHKQGHWVNIQSRGRVSRWDADGRPVEMVGVHIDVTALKQAEQRLEDIIQAASVGTWEHANGVNTINGIWAEMLGYDATHLTADPDYWPRLVHPDDMRNLETGLLAKLATGVDRFENELRLRHRDGHWIWVSSRGKVTRRDAEGRVVATAGIHIDITEAKSREMALQKAYDDLNQATSERDTARQLFADIASVSADWFWETDDHHRLTFLSDSLTRATGLDPARLLGKTMHEIAARTPAMLQSADWDALTRTIEARATISDFVYMVPRQTGQTWVRTSGTPVFAADGSFLGYRGVCSDITQLYIAKERAEAANRAKSQFLANMSHEIRTPLNGVLGMAELLSDAISDPVQRQMIGTIRESGEGLLNVLNDILDLAKVEAGKLDLELSSFVPRDLAAKVEALYSLRAHDRGLSFSVLADAGSSRPRLGDPHRILQVLHNLISNAIKFTHEGSITVVMRAKTGCPVEIEVKDSGIGMTEEQAARVFEDFEQADGATSRRYGGTGLGLSIVRHLVELMKGSVSVSSEPGRGTTVSLTLPLTEPEAVTLPEAPAATETPLAFPGLRVLVADDNATNRLILKAMLGALGVMVTCVEDGERAITAAAGQDFDVLMLDISMPGKDGVETLAAIRDMQLPQPAIAVTANAMKHQIDSYFEAGFADYVAKPFRRDDLARALARVRQPAPG